MINISHSIEPEHGNHYSDPKLKKQALTTKRKDFFNLCYLCETHAPRPGTLDHFYPQAEFPEKKEAWNNLYFCCSTCNGVRPKNINTTGNEVYDNCSDNVESLVQLRFDLANKQVEVVTDGTEKGINTKILLERIYNGKGNTKSLEYVELQKEIRDKLNRFKETVDSYFALQEKSLKKNYQNIVVEHLSKEYQRKDEITDYNCTGFISFKRQIIKDEPAYAEFLFFFD